MYSGYATAPPIGCEYPTCPSAHSTPATASPAAAQRRSWSMARSSTEPRTVIGAGPGMNHIFLPLEAFRARSLGGLRRGLSPEDSNPLTAMGNRLDHRWIALYRW